MQRNLHVNVDTSLWDRLGRTLGQLSRLESVNVVAIPLDPNWDRLMQACMAALILSRQSTPRRMRSCCMGSTVLEETWPRSPGPGPGMHGPHPGPFQHHMWSLLALPSFPHVDLEPPSMHTLHIAPLIVMPIPGAVVRDMRFGARGNRPAWF